MKVLVIAPTDWAFVPYQISKLRTLHEVSVLRPWFTRGPRWFVALAAVWQGFWTDTPTIDVVHAYSAWPAGIIGAIVACRNAVPLVVHEHLSPATRLDRLPLAVRVLESCARVVVPSAWQAARVRMVADVAPMVVRNPVEVTAAVVPMPSTVSTTRIVCAGRLEHRKGFDRVIAAMRYLPKNWVLYVVGAGPEWKRLKMQAMNTGCLVVIVPPVPHDTLLRWLASADVVVCPSRDESFGLVAAEAWALGITVVASHCGAHEDYSLVSTLATDQDNAVAWSTAISAAAKLDAVRFHPNRAWALGTDFAERMTEAYAVPNAEEACA